MLWIVLGAVLLMAGSPAGRWTVPIAAWVAPIFVIRFVRHESRPAHLLLGSAVLLAANALPWYHVAPGPVLPWVVGLVFLLPYAVDRLATPRLGGVAGSLVFPLAWTALDFANTRLDPLGSWGSLAYTQYGDLPLMQLVSVTGAPGLTFLIAWLGPVANLVWERGLQHQDTRRASLLFAATLGAVLLYGGARLRFTVAGTGTVRISGISESDREDLAALFREAPRDWEGFRNRSRSIQGRYLQATAEQARAGSRVIVWPEATAAAAGEDEHDLVSRGRAIASAYGVYLAMGLMTFDPASRRPFENKLLIAGPSGDLAIEHEKYGGSFLEGTRRGDAVLHAAETPFGTLSGVICWDMDFAHTIHQAGRNGTDIMVVPSLDWREIDPVHTQMAVFRAIENGFSLVRQAENGLSLATDFAGRPIAAMDHFSTSERVLVAQVPTTGVRTIYGAIGDLVGWLASSGLLVLGVVAGRRSSRRGRRRRPGRKGIDHVLLATPTVHLH